VKLITLERTHHIVAFIKYYGTRGPSFVNIRLALALASASVVCYLINGVMYARLSETLIIIVSCGTGRRRCYRRM